MVMKSTNLKSRQQHFLRKPPKIMNTYISAYTVCLKTPKDHAWPKICYIWNGTPGICPVPKCQYEHSCVHCAHNPSVQDKKLEILYSQAEVRILVTFDICT